MTYGFTCTDGFLPSPASNPTICACDGPSVICNGQCVTAGACPSSQALFKKWSWVGSGSCVDMGRGWVPCGVLGGGPHAWECVNSARDLESCKYLLSHSTVFRKLRNLSGAKVVAVCTLLRPTLPTAKTARHSLESQM